MKRFARRGPGWLNPQVALALQARGVPPSTFSELASRTAARLHACLDSPAAAALAAREGLLRSPSRTAGGACLLSLLAASGVADGAGAHATQRAVQAAAHRLTHRCGVFLERSARLLLVPDPTGTLRPGEAYLRPDAEGPCVTGRVVAARNPCLDPNEVVLLQGVSSLQHRAWAPLSPSLSLSLTHTSMRPTAAVDERQDAVLGSLWGVLVLSVRGRVSDAARMGGGDFDGDDALVIWEPDLVDKVAQGGQERTGAGEEEERERGTSDPSSSPAGQAAALTAALRRAAEVDSEVGGAQSEGTGQEAPGASSPDGGAVTPAGRPAACFAAWARSFDHTELGRVSGPRRARPVAVHPP